MYAWGRNVFDEDYTTRGFFFGNEPPDFTNKRYTQLGEPRQVRGHFPLGVQVMRTAIEISLYPLDADIFRRSRISSTGSTKYPELHVTTSAMSTQIAGEHARLVRDSWARRPRPVSPSTVARSS